MIILFDLDDTLINTKYTVETAAERLFTTFQAVFPHDSLDLFVEDWHNSLPKYFKYYEIGQMSLYQLGANRILDLTHQAVSTDQAMEMYEVYLDTLNNNTVLFDDAIACLTQLKNFRLGLITNGQIKLQTKKIRDVQLQDWFEHIVISEQVGKAKPSPTIFNYAKDLFSSNEQFLYIGDKLDSDAKASQETGCIGVWLNRNTQKSEYNLDGVQVINSLIKLPALVENYVSSK